MFSEISIPGKIFILGEYSVALGGPALIAAVGPRFSLQNSQQNLNSEHSALAIHPQSPAGRLLKPDLHRGRTLEFVDPHNGAGGFGGSTAQFALVWKAQNQETEPNWLEMLREYREITQNPRGGLKPSGADLVAQWWGGISYFDPSVPRREDWTPIFERAGLQGRMVVFSASHSTRKTQTHTHLANLDVDKIPAVELRKISDRAFSALKLGELGEFARQCTAYAEALFAVGLEHPGATADRLAFLNIPGVIGAKGCGALLSDALLVFIDPALSDSETKRVVEEVKKVGQERDLKFIDFKLESGISVCEQTQAPSIRVRAPSNIALVKYMGKQSTEGNVPENSSLSLTLKGLHTECLIFPTWCDQITIEGADGTRLSEAERQKALAHFKRVDEWLEENATSWELELLSVKSGFEVRTSNSFPKSAGIASSASAFAALTLAAVLMRVTRASFLKTWESATDGLQFRQELARLSRVGSGSSCRSFLGPWVEWEPSGRVREVPSQLPPLADIVIVLSKSAKLVSSSEAHRRVRTSPNWEGRPARAESRLKKIKSDLAQGLGAWNSLAQTVFDEMLDMHQLFQTSEPPFTYFLPETAEFFEWARSTKIDGRVPLLTLDAGPNPHLLVPAQDAAEWKQVIERRYEGVAPNLEILVDFQGTGIEIDWS